ncbi:MAG: MmcQ/YjbR family DNA-binding protein [Tepidanaerobacteraceae bacterium]|jgi:hypothetical protein|nr:MmcQ/YjbR family DNA-binding protein [Tepidanaerobacteraceae bacterium]
MTTIETIREIALSFPEVTEAPHFEKTSFSVKKKIFVTYDDKLNRACVKLSEIDQNIFSLADSTHIYPVKNKWGKQGWTFVQLGRLNKDILKDILTTAYCRVAPKKYTNQTNYKL